MYNRYACCRGDFRRTEPQHEPCRPQQGCDPPPTPTCSENPRSRESSNPLSFLGLKNFNIGNLNILPKDMDFGDMLLFLALILLYLKNKDEECLIMLLVLLFMN